MSMDSLQTKVDLAISCRRLSNLDTFSKSDPYVKVFSKNEAPRGSNQPVNWRLEGQTEMKKDNLNPDFDKAVRVIFKFESL